MSTSVDTITYIHDQLAHLGPRIRSRKMFGEYALYCDEKVVALICDDTVYVKITPAGKAFVGDTYRTGFPYPGAKPAIELNSDFLDNPSRFCELTELTAKSLPLPKSKTRKSKVIS
jgi:TfoX/Sxy family transcriptional regulator of competence genes